MQQIQKYKESQESQSCMIDHYQLFLIVNPERNIPCESYKELKPSNQQNTQKVNKINGLLEE